MNKATLGLGGYFSNPEHNPIAIIKEAFNEGIRFFDTSPVYKSEEYFGNALKRYNRLDYMLSTKTKATNKEELYENLSSSLRKLQTSYIDIYFGHSFIDDEDTFFKHLPVLADIVGLKQQGFVNYVGVSGHSVRAAILAVDSGLVDYIMVPHSIMYRQFDYAIKYAKSKGVKVITMKNFASGILLGGPGKPNAYNRSITLQDILSFSATVDGVDFIIPSARYVDQLYKITDAYKNVTKPSLQFQNWLQTNIINLLGEDFCRYCNECRPCNVYGWQMSQPNILKSLLYDQKFGIDSSKSYLSNNLNIDSCSSCDNLCSARCPFGIDIKGKMKEAHLYFNRKGV